MPVFDHGFLYGEGVYEVCRSYYGKPFLLDRHLARLRKSASFIALPVPFGDDGFAARIEDTMKAASLSPWTPRGPDAYIRLLLPPGIGALTYDPAATPVPTLVIIARPHKAPDQIYDEGVALSICAHSAQRARRSIRSSNPTTCSTTRWRCSVRWAPAASRR